MLSLALKNIFYYTGRSLTTFILSAVSTLLFVVYVAFMDGSHEAMLKSSLEIYTGALEIMEYEQRKNPSYDTLLQNVDEITSKLKNLKGVKAFAPRLESYALLSGDEDSIGAMVAGIEPEKEAEISKLKTALKEGRYLKTDDTNAIYIGSDLAKRINVKVGDKVALVGSATDYSFAAGIFKVVGIFETGLFSFDASSSFVNKPYFDDLMLSQGLASYIVVTVDDLSHVDDVAESINTLLPKHQEAATWKVLMHDMVQAMEVDSLFGYITLALFFVVIFFVVMIYGFMNISGRIKELGVLRALGVKADQLLTLLLLETAILAITSVIMGTLIGAYLSYYFELNPIVIEGIAESYKQYGVISDEIPTRYDLFTVIWNGLLILVLNFLALIYPIYYIKQFSPTEAMRHV